MTFDLLTISGIIALLVVIAALLTLCKLRGCNKPIC